MRNVLQIGEAALQFRNPFFGAAFAAKPCSGIVSEPRLKQAMLIIVLLQLEFQLVLERTAAIVQRMADTIGRVRLDMTGARLDQARGGWWSVGRGLGLRRGNPEREERADDEQ